MLTSKWFSEEDDNVDTHRLLCIEVMGSHALRLTLNLSPVDMHMVPSLPGTRICWVCTMLQRYKVTSNAVEVTVKSGDAATAPPR